MGAHASRPPRPAPRAAPRLGDPVPSAQDPLPDFDALIASGEAPDWRAEQNATLLHVAAGGTDDPALLRRLVAAGVPVDGRTKTGVTALMLAASTGRARSVRALLGLGAVPTAVDKNGRNALHWAADAAQDFVLEIEAGDAAVTLLCGNPGLNVPDVNGVTADEIAAGIGWTDLAALIRAWNTDT